MGYRTGKITVTNGSNVVIGAGTEWADTKYGVLSNTILKAPDGRVYEIESVVNNGKLILHEPYTGPSAESQSYSVITTYIGDMSQFAAQFNSLLEYYRKTQQNMRDVLTGSGNVDVQKDDGTVVPVPTLSNAMLKGQFGWGGQAVNIPGGTNILDYFKTPPQSGIYSSTSGDMSGVPVGPSGADSGKYEWILGLNSTYGTLHFTSYNIPYYSATNILDNGTWRGWVTDWNQSNLKNPVTRADYLPPSIFTKTVIDSGKWVKIVVRFSNNSGAGCVLSFTSGWGYNGNLDQMSLFDVFIRTGNTFNDGLFSAILTYKSTSRPLVDFVLRVSDTDLQTVELYFRYGTIYPGMSSVSIADNTFIDESGTDLIGVIVDAAPTTNIRPTLVEHLHTSQSLKFPLTEDTSQWITGEKQFRRDNEAFRIFGLTQGAASYILAQEADGSNRWYLGRGTANSDVTTFSNYIGGASVHLRPNGSIQLDAEDVVFNRSKGFVRNSKAYPGFANLNELLAYWRTEQSAGSAVTNDNFKWRSFINVRHRGGNGNGEGGSNDSGDWGFCLLDEDMVGAGHNFRIIKMRSGVWDGGVDLYHTGNATADANGHLKVASPIVKLFADGSSELNAESNGVVTTRLSEGVYQITGCLGLNADRAWGGEDGGITNPKCRNGYERIWNDYDVQEDGSLIIRTYHRVHSDAMPFAQNRLNLKHRAYNEKRDSEEWPDRSPIDIPLDTYLTVRVQMPDSEETPYAPLSEF